MVFPFGDPAGIRTPDTLLKRELCQVLRTFGLPNNWKHKPRHARCTCLFECGYTCLVLWLNSIEIHTRCQEDWYPKGTTVEQLPYIFLTASLGLAHPLHEATPWGGIPPLFLLLSFWVSTIKMTDRKWGTAIIKTQQGNNPWVKNQNKKGENKKVAWSNPSTREIRQVLLQLHLLWLRFWLSWLPLKIAELL